MQCESTPNLFGCGHDCNLSTHSSEQEREKESKIAIGRANTKMCKDKHGRNSSYVQHIVHRTLLIAIWVNAAYHNGWRRKKQLRNGRVGREANAKAKIEIENKCQNCQLIRRCGRLSRRTADNFWAMSKPKVSHSLSFSFLLSLALGSSLTRSHGDSSSVHPDISTHSIHVCALMRLIRIEILVFFVFLVFTRNWSIVRCRRRRRLPSYSSHILLSK